MNSTELLSCPFCGAEADIDSPLSSGKERLVYCKGCFASICEDSTPNSIAAWNRRASINSVVCEAGGWRPIETAPKDDGDLILTDGAIVTYGGWVSDIDQGADWEGQTRCAGWWIIDGKDGFNPTHWQPLPPPPGSARDSAEADKDGVADKEMEPAPPNSLPKWDECALRVSNSEFIAKRVAEGGYGAEPDSLLATELHRFIYEYDDADPYRSAWFLHRLELLINEIRAEADKTKAGGVAQRAWPAGLLDRVKAAERRVQDNHAPRSIPANPHGDVDLVLAEVRHLIEGTWPPFWIKDAAGMSAEGGSLSPDSWPSTSLDETLTTSPKAGESRTEPDGVLASDGGEQ